MIAYVNDTISHNAENIFTCFMKSTRTFPPLTSVYAKRFTACFIARWSMSMWWKLFYEWNNKIDRRESFPLSCKPAAFSAHSEKKWRKNIEKRSDDEIFCHKSHSHVETCMWESVKKSGEKSNTWGKLEIKVEFNFVAGSWFSSNSIITQKIFLPHSPTFSAKDGKFKFSAISSSSLLLSTWSRSRFRDSKVIEILRLWHGVWGMRRWFKQTKSKSNWFSISSPTVCVKLMRMFVISSVVVSTSLHL